MQEKEKGATNGKQPGARSFDYTSNLESDVFGANLFQRVWRVILPLLKPSLQVALILRTILAFQVFATVIVLGARGVTVLTRESYRWYDQFLNPHIAAAYASLILLLSLISTGIILWLLRTPREQRMV